MSARVYVAAPFTEWRLAREVQSAIVSKGGVISEDWTFGIEAIPAGLTDNDADEDVALAAALLDLKGVLSADACIFLTVEDKTKGKGMWVELGAAIVSRCLNVQNLHAAGTQIADLDRCPRIAVCGPHRDSTIFSRLGRRFSDWRDALPYVLGETP